MYYRYLLLFLLSVPVSLFAQKNNHSDFVVLHSGDTLYGSITLASIRPNPEKLIFTQDEKEIVYTPNDLKGFFLIHKNSGHYFESWPVSSLQKEKPGSESAGTDSLVFLYVYLKDKPMSLYYYKENTPIFLIQRNNEALTILEKPASNAAYHQKYKRILSAYLSDWPESSQEIKAVRYNSLFLQNLLQKYNNTINADHFADYRFEQAEPIESNFSLIIGTSLSFFEFTSQYPYFNYLEEGQQDPTFQPVLGISYSMPISKKDHSIYLYNSLSYQAYKTKITYIGQEDYWRYRTNSEIQAAYVKLNSMLGWNLKSTEYAPYLQVGIWAAHAFRVLENSKNSYRMAPSDENYEFLSSGPALDNYKKSEYGLALGLGLRQKKLSAELRTEGGSGMSNYLYLNARSLTFSLLLQYQL